MVPRQKVKFQVKICKNKITIDSCLEMKNNPVFHETFPVRRPKSFTLYSMVI